MKEKKLTHSEKTRIKILSAGCEIWRKSPEKVNPVEVAKHVGMTRPGILFHFPADTLRDAVAEYAVKIADSFVIVQLIAINHPAVEKLGPRQKSVHIKAVNQPRLI